MRGFRSIRWQLQAWHGLLLAVILGGLGVTAWLFERAHQLKTLDQHLQSLAALTANSTRPGGPRNNPERRRGPREFKMSPEMAPLFAQGGDYYFAFWLKNGPPFTASETAPESLPRPAENTSGLRQRGNYREAYFSPAPGDTFLVGTSLDQMNRRFVQVAAVVTAVGLAIWGAGMLVGSWFIGRSLRPIAAISEAAAGIAEGNLSRRIEIREAESELGALAGTLNATFARLDAVFARQAQFTADAAHELRTPVTVLLTHIQNTLNTDDLSPDNREALEACQRAAQRMRRLIESLLQLARFEAGSERLEENPCDLAEIARECLQLTLPLAEARKLTLSSELAEAPCRGDHDRLSQVLINLLSNAVHYNREGGQISVSTKEENGWAVCAITNTGQTIKAADRAHIFERFYRADAARSPTGRSGLGLAISRAIVQAHGGQIEAHCAEDQTTFTFRLPQKPSAAHQKG
jgi:two-component system OmpR family sensor kinase